MITPSLTSVTPKSITECCATLHYVAIIPAHRRSSRLAERERPGLSVGVVHAAFDLIDFATLVTISAVGANAIDDVGPRGVKLGLHVLLMPNFGMILNAGGRDDQV